MVGALALGLGACGDDEETVTVTQEDYDEEVARLCEQHGRFFARAYTDRREDSDAEEVAFYRSDFFPRVRAMVRSVDEMGFPPDKDADYRAALNEALGAMSEIEAEPYRYLDERQRREFTPEEDPINRFRAALARADVPCS